MKSLVLYIDKWYIVGAVNTDGIARPLNLPNHEDRIWLYFHEDVANDEISYGLGFEDGFRNNEPHYYGDVFSSIVSSDAKYTMFKRSQRMRGIFKSANIFDNLRKDVDGEGDIHTFVSFSSDITPGARHIFLEELREDGFVVEESVARISHLALEYASKRTGFTEDGYYLTLDACNENLHYALYQKTEDLFNRDGDGALWGMGTDVRSRALIEHVVDSINDREHFLQTKEEREAEYLRMNLFVESWLDKLSSAKNSIPVQITGVTFSHDPHKEYSVQVKKSKIDERTDKIVKDIISVIVRFVKDAGVSHEQVKGVVLIGDCFTNIQFKKELHNYYNLDDDRFTNVREADLPTIVNAYTFIDCSQFSATRNAMRGNAEAELRRIKIAEEEAAAMKRAREEADAQAAQEKEANEAERKFKDAMDKGYDAEREHNYDDMADYFNIASSLRPDDEEAKQKKEEALRKKAEMAVQQNHYKEKIQQAKAAYDDGDYETAKFKSEEALSFMPDSREAQRIKDDSSRRIKSQKELDRYLDRTDLFIAQKAYAEARQELQKAKLLDVDDTEIVKREARIDKEQQEATRRAENLTEMLDRALNEENFDDALAYCNELIEVDFANSKRWSAKISDINIKKERATEERRQLRKLSQDIDSAQWAEEWDRMASLCREALEIKDDEDIRKKLQKAEAKAAAEKGLKAVDQAIAEVKDLILASHFKDAKEKLTSLRRTDLDPTREARVKELNRLIFMKEDEAENIRLAKLWQEGGQGDNKHLTPDKSQEHKAPSNAAKPKVNTEDWDFGEAKKQKPRPCGGAQKTDEDFFDSDTTPSKATMPKTAPKATKKTTEDDFNF